MTRLHVLMNRRHLGTLEGSGRGLRLRYEQGLNPTTTVPLSLSLPLGVRRHR